MKKILLLGEYSGLHKNLKEGLVELGYNVTFASAGDGVKDIQGDIDIAVNSKSMSDQLVELIGLKKTFKQFTGYDVVQFINPYVTHKLAIFFYNKIIQNNNSVYCLAAGDDVQVMNFLKSNGMKKYSPLENMLIDNDKIPYSSIYDKYIFTNFMNKMDGIIPVMMEYAETYRNSPFYNKTHTTIPLPINTNGIRYQENRVNNKVIFYHSSKRAKYKGSDIITKAMNIFQDKYPNDVEMINAEFLPLNEYLEVISKSNIIIDQCRSYSYGMNALYSMAKGKIVMSGAEPEALIELGIKTSPVINITPSVDQMLMEFELIMDNRNLIVNKGEESRKYVEKYHDSTMVAQQYLSSWESVT